MFTSLFHALPGPTWVRVLVLAAAAAVVVVALFGWGFPYLADLLNRDGATLG